MSRYVVDASAAVEYLLRTELGLRLAEIADDALLIAPELLDVEVVSVLRRAVLHKKFASASLFPEKKTISLPAELVKLFETTIVFQRLF